MKDEQKRLDRGAERLMMLIKEAEIGAGEACDEGDMQTAAALHRVAAYCRLAYAEGRTIQTAGGIRPFSGGK